jgi:hypothetical protein
MGVRATQVIGEAAQSPTAGARASQTVAEVARVLVPPTYARTSQVCAEAAQTVPKAVPRLSQLTVEVAIGLGASLRPFEEHGLTLACDRWM